MAVAVPHRRIGRIDRTRTGYLRRDVGLMGLMFASLGSIIGSGWLFGALYAAQVAGPAALVSWGLGAAFVLILALVHAELGGAYPVAGGSARFPHYAYGSVIGFGIGWIAWLGAVTTAPIEVEAALQYGTHYISWLTKTSGGETVLTAEGYAIAAVLMLVFTVVNILGVAKLAKSNNAITVWKIAIPAIAIVALMVTVFHGGNFHAAGGFNPYGWHGIFSAISTGGVIFAYLGFEQAIQLGGESSNPRRNIPLAVISAMIVGVIVYVMLQVAFLGALEPKNLTHGWDKLAFTGLVGPFAGLATTLGLGWLAVTLYIDAAISPGGTGLLYTGTSARLSYALGREGFVPPVFSWLSDRGVPFFSIVWSFAVGMILFLPFPGWQKLVGFIVSATVMAYALAPLALGALRRQDPGRERPFRLPVADIAAPLGFVVANLIIYWSGWTVDWRLFVAIGIGIGIVAAFSVAIYVLALAVRLSPERTQEYIGDLTAEDRAEAIELRETAPHIP